MQLVAPQRCTDETLIQQEINIHNRGHLSDKHNVCIHKIIFHVWQFLPPSEQSDEVAGGRLTFDPLSFIHRCLMDFEETRRSNRSSYCLRVCHLSCTLRDPSTLWSLQLKRRGRGHLSLFCSSLYFQSQLPKRPDKPPRDGKHCRNVGVPHSTAAGMFPVYFFVFFFLEGERRGSGDIIMHHILVADKQLWSNRASSKR